MIAYPGDLIFVQQECATIHVNIHVTHPTQTTLRGSGQVDGNPPDNPFVEQSQDGFAGQQEIADMGG
jgi:hypothetical protein